MFHKSLLNKNNTSLVNSALFPEGKVATIGSLPLYTIGWLRERNDITCSWALFIPLDARCLSFLNLPYSKKEERKWKEERKKEGRKEREHILIPWDISSSSKARGRNCIHVNVLTWSLNMYGNQGLEFIPLELAVSMV